MFINSISTLLLLLMICLAVTIDIRSNRIPNWITFSTLIFGLSTQLILNGSDGLIFALGGVALGFICFFPFYLKRGMGAGDVKLMAVIGSFLGFQFTLLAVAYTLIFGGLMGMLIILKQGETRNLFKRYLNMASISLATRKFFYIPPAENDPGNSRFAYALAIAGGTCVALYQNGAIGELTKLTGLA